MQIIHTFNCIHEDNIPQVEIVLQRMMNPCLCQCPGILGHNQLRLLSVSKCKRLHVGIYRFFFID